MGHEICIRSNRRCHARQVALVIAPLTSENTFQADLSYPSPRYIFRAGFLCSGIFFILVSFIFIHLIKYQTTYISLQALFSLAYFDRSFLSSPKCPLKYFRKEVFCLATQHFGRFLLDGITFWTGVCFSMLSDISSGTIQYFNLLSSLSQNENHCSTL